MYHTLKRVLGIVIVTVLLVMITGCKYIEKTIDSTQDYNQIFNLSEIRTDGSLPIFPESIDSLETVFFKCVHTTNLPLGSSIQIQLTIKYDNQSYVEEIQKLERKCESSIVYGENAFFDKSAYAFVWNLEGCFEYAVVSPEIQEIEYIYLQSVSPEDLFISEDAIPHKYDDLYDVENNMERFTADNSDKKTI